MTNAFDPSGNTNQPIVQPKQWWQDVNGATSPWDTSALWTAEHTPGGMSTFEPNGGAINLDSGPPPSSGVVTPSAPQTPSTQNTLTPQAGFAGANYVNTRAFDDGGDVENDGDADDAPGPSAMRGAATGGAAGGGRYPTLDKAHSIVDALVKWAEKAYQTPLSDDYQEQGAADGGAISVDPQQPQAQGPTPAAMRVLTHADRASPAHVQILERGAPAQHPADKALLAIGRAAQAHPQAGFAVMQHYLAQYDHMRNFAKAALQAGHADKAAAALTKAYDALPDGSHVQFQPSPDGGLVASLGDQDQADDADAASQEQSAAAGGAIGPLDGLQPGSKAPAYEDGDEVEPNDPDQPASFDKMAGMARDAAGAVGNAIGNKVRDVGETLSRAGTAYWNAGKKVAGELAEDLGQGAGVLETAEQQGAFAPKGTYTNQFKLTPEQAVQVASKPAFPALNDGAVHTLSEAAKSGYSSPDENAPVADPTGYSSPDEGAEAAEPVEKKASTIPEGVDPKAWHEFTKSGGGGFNPDGTAAYQTPPPATDMPTFQRWLQAKATVTGQRNQQQGWTGRPNAPVLDAINNFAQNAPIAQSAKNKLLGLTKMPGAGDMDVDQFTDIAVQSGVNTSDLQTFYKRAGVPDAEIKKLLAPYQPSEDQPQQKAPKAPPTVAQMKDTAQPRQSAQQPQLSTDERFRRYADRDLAEQRRSEEDRLAAGRYSPLAQRMRARQAERRQRRYPQGQ